MSQTDSRISAPWRYYADRARQTHVGRVDAFGYGREELLHEILDAIQSHVVSADACLERLDRVPWNREKSIAA